MTGDPAWKQLERRVAVYLEGARNPLSGGSRGRSRTKGNLPGRTRGDGILPYPIFLECKHGKQAISLLRSRARLVTLFEETAWKAVEEGKIPVVVLHPPRWPGGVGNYPAFIETEVSRPGAEIGRESPALLLKRSTLIQVPLSEIKKALKDIEGPFKKGRK